MGWASPIPLYNSLFMVSEELFMSSCHLNLNHSISHHHLINIQKPPSPHQHSHPSLSLLNFRNEKWQNCFCVSSRVWVFWNQRQGQHQCEASLWAPRGRHLWQNVRELGDRPSHHRCEAEHQTQGNTSPTSAQLWLLMSPTQELHVAPQWPRNSIYKWSISLHLYCLRILWRKSLMSVAHICIQTLSNFLC